MDGFERRRQEKKKDIMETAFELFNMFGIDEVKVTDIAKKAGVSKVTIYNYFGNKMGLAREVLYEYMDNRLGEFKKIMEKELSFKEKFDSFFELKIAAGKELHESFLSPKMMAYPDMQEFLQTYYEEKSKPLFIEFIEQGKRKGYIDPGLSNEVLLVYLESFKDLSSIPMKKKDRIDIAKLIFYGLRGK